MQPADRDQLVERLIPLIWSINAIRRALSRLSQTWVNRLQHPEEAVASIQLSRENSLEEVNLPVAAPSKAHSRQPSTVDGSESLEVRASGLKTLVGSILSAADEGRSNSVLPAEDRAPTSGTQPAPAVPALQPGEAGPESPLGSQQPSERGLEHSTDVVPSPFQARSLASDEKDDDSASPSEESGGVTTNNMGSRARGLNKSFTAPANNLERASLRGNHSYQSALSPIRQVSQFPHCSRQKPCRIA